MFAAHLICLIIDWYYILHLLIAYLEWVCFFLFFWFLSYFIILENSHYFVHPFFLFFFFNWVRTVNETKPVRCKKKDKIYFDLHNLLDFWEFLWWVNMFVLFLLRFRDGKTSLLNFSRISLQKYSNNDS